jgi:hypothetical protein
VQTERFFKTMTYQDYLEKMYYDPQHPGSFGGVDKLYKAVRQEGKYVLGKAKIKKWLETATYTSLGFAANSKRTYVLSTDHVSPLYKHRASSNSTLHISSRSLDRLINN